MSHISFRSSTLLLVALLYPNSFLPSELVRSYSLRNIVLLSQSDTLIPPFLHPSVAFLPMHFIPSFSLHVGDLVLLEKNQRAPANLTLLCTSDSSGTCFIHTDQLDGKTDWKLHVALPMTQKLPFGHEHLNIDAEIYGMSLKSPLCLFVLLPLLQ
jgi:hypothetical protein